MKRQYDEMHYDACAIIALVDKRGESTHANIFQTIDALRKMGHRSGDINGEGDGCGISTDIPREIWAKRLSAAKVSPHLAESQSFFVGHLFIPASARANTKKIQSGVRRILKKHKAEILAEEAGATRDEELGPRARADAPLFWQMAGLMAASDRRSSARALFGIQLEIESLFPDLHIASLSLDSAAYKVQGVPDLLPRVYPELLDEDMRSIMTLGHSRYSTNTLPTVTRSQPFSLLGHNGEINTIERLRNTGRALGIPPVPSGSDSQDLNRVIEGLINLYGLSLEEAMEMVFPAIYSEVERYGDKLRKLYTFYRWFFPSSAQGPAAVVARHGDMCMGSVDALGLRPLWFGESDYNFFLSSEKGVVDLERTMADPRPLAPGEKIGIVGGRGRRARAMDYGALQEELVQRMAGREKSGRYLSSLYTDIPAAKKGTPPPCPDPGKRTRKPACLRPIGFESTTILGAFGWSHYDLSIRKNVSQTGREVIGSMGHTGPLAAFVPEALPNVSDYFKENVAVVTNPAIDREREAEHFSTRLVLGSRPDIQGDRQVSPLGLEMQTPLLVSGCDLDGLLDIDQCRQVARSFATHLFEDVVDFFSGQRRDPARVRMLDATFVPDQGLSKNLDRLANEALEAVKNGCVLLVLDDSESFCKDRTFVDPALAVAKVHEALIAAGIRRETGLVVRSGAIRNLHDIMFLLGLGADALNPYLLWRVSCSHADEKRSARDILSNTITVLLKGVEKVMSTMGIHELCGYGRIFSSIGLSRPVSAIMRTANFCASDQSGLTLGVLEKLGRLRLQRAAAAEETPVHRDPARNPKVGKIMRDVAVGRKGYLELATELDKIAEAMPTGIRHLLKATNGTGNRLAMDQVDITIGSHDMPLVIAAMSFGSQGESSFRAYAEAARKANIVCMNGEGGEIPDMLGKYRRNRGQQIASGRFGVFMGFLNSADFLEIKIGQGAKPGEGGHLPGNKVSAMVATARHCKPGITLISPSNHHDIYSIEDLAQIVTELKTANPQAKVSVKIPVTSGVGTIAVGVAKAGADIINISGFEGGTGAAREHAKRFVGLPVEIGVREAHRALLESGLRDSVEIWADGGLRSGDDVLKMILLGANRAGLGTVALMGVGCISCQRCHLDTCPRGISTQMRTKDDAEAKGVKGFFPRNHEEESENLARLLGAIGDELRMRLAELGEVRLQDLVGRTDLLVQYRFQDRIDVSDMLRLDIAVCDPDQFPRPQIVRKPLSYLTKMIADLALQQFSQGTSEVRFAEEGVRSTDRAVGTYLAGAMERELPGRDDCRAIVRLGSSVPGNGLCAFTIPRLDTVVEGGSQDGAAKGASGGQLGVLKGKNLLGRRVDGSTGKSFAYGAIGGLLMVQNMADSRACIRLSGADVVFGARITAPLEDHRGNLATRSHLKGFAFEYMTGGRAVVLGDPGPWICAGMTGGVIYQCLYPDLGFDQAALARRLAKGANVQIQKISEEGLLDVQGLLGQYTAELRKSFQNEEAAAIDSLLKDAARRFVMIVPRSLRTVSAE